MKFRNRLEFGISGSEGIRGEGVRENKGWASLEEVPFAGNISEEMIQEADKINAMLGSIETFGFEDDQNTESKTDVKIDDIKSQPENYRDETLRQIEELEANPHKYFG